MSEEKKCLMIVDVQKGFINEHTKHIPERVEAIQRHYEFVYITRFVNEEGSPFRKLIKWDKLAPETADAELAFRPRKDAVIIFKNIYTCVNKSFLSGLVKNRINTIHICGVDTDICVTKIAVDLFEHNFTPLVLKDYCATSAGEESHRFALNTLGRYIGEGQII